MSRKCNIITRVDCSCSGVVKGTRPKVCPHHNHLVCVPDSAKEWDYAKNTTSPDKVSVSSPTKAWWICSKCSISYQQNISTRTLYNTRCPYCAAKKASPNANLKILHPELMDQWDYHRNELGPENYRPGSNKKVWWLCRADKHREELNGIFGWQAKITDRTKRIATGCPSCNMSGYDQIKGGTREYIRQCSIIHGNKYIYDKVNYTTSDAKVCIICPIVDSNGIMHGEFIKAASSHKAGHGCPKCGDASYAQRIGGQDHFISEANRIHGLGRYDYSLVNYVDSHIPLEIICNMKSKDGTVHGIFMQNSNNHKNGKGCPKCADQRKISRKAQEIYDYLVSIGYCNDDVSMKMEWSDVDNLKDKAALRIDYYLFDCQLMIEVDGAQHFKETLAGTFTSNSKRPLIDRLRKDMLKDSYSLMHSKSMLRIPYNQTAEESIAWIEYAVRICRNGQRVYFSYPHFHDVLSKLGYVGSDIYVFIVPSPNLVFIDSRFNTTYN